MPNKMRNGRNWQGRRWAFWIDQCIFSHDQIIPHCQHRICTITQLCRAKITSAWTHRKTNKGENNLLAWNNTHTNMFHSFSETRNVKSTNYYMRVIIVTIWWYTNEKHRYWQRMNRNVIHSTPRNSKSHNSNYRLTRIIFLDHFIKIYIIYFNSKYRVTRIFSLGPLGFELCGVNRVSNLWGFLEHAWETYSQNIFNNLWVVIITGVELLFTILCFSS